RSLKQTSQAPNTRQSSGEMFWRVASWSTTAGRGSSRWISRLPRDLRAMCRVARKPQEMGRPTDKALQPRHFFIVSEIVAASGAPITCEPQTGWALSAQRPTQRKELTMSAQETVRPSVPLFIAKTSIESQRSSGYSGTHSAVNEFVD